MELKNFLEKLGLKTDEIEDVLELVPNEIDNVELYKKIKYLLEEVKCNLRIIRIILEENPLFMTTELNEIIEMIEYLRKKELEEYILNILEMNPEILSVSVSTLKRNEEILKLVLPEYMIKMLLKDRMEIFTYNSEYLANRLTFLVNEGFKEQIDKIIISYIEIFELDEDEIDIKLLKENLG